MYHVFLKKSTFAGLVVVVLLAPCLAWAAVPTDQEYAKQEQVYNQISAPAAWEMATGSRKVVVAIIDTGVDIWHQDLRDNIWVNPGEIPDNSIDDDNNGYVDDVNGWNFVDDNNNPRPSVFFADDDSGAVRHGTVAAGIIGATANNGLDSAGINWRVQIMAVRAVDNAGDGNYGEIGAAVDYAVNNGASVISMSFVGGSPDDTLKSILKRAYDRGVVIVAAAGNSRRMGWGDTAEHQIYPACFDAGEENWILGVTSVDATGQLSVFANYGPCADIAAPGEKIFSTERYAPEYGYSSTFSGPWNGTSFSAPFVAGAAALVKSIHPEWKAEKIISALMGQNGDPVLLASTPAASIPVLDLAMAVKRAQSIAPTIKILEQRQFFVKFGEIYFRNVITGEKSTYFTAVPGGVVKAVSKGDFNNDWSSELAAVVYRASFYHLRLIKNDGSLWREFYLDIAKGKNVKSVVTAKNAQAIPNIIIEVFDSKKNSSQFFEYNIFGNVVQVSVPLRAVHSWQVTDNNEILVKVTGPGKKPKLTPMVVKWYN